MEEKTREVIIVGGDGTLQYSRVVVYSYDTSAFDGILCDSSIVIVINYLLWY